MTTKPDAQATYEKWLGSRADDPTLPHDLIRDAFLAGIKAERQGRMPSDADYCTDPDNCRRCQTIPEHRGDMRHAGIGNYPEPTASAEPVYQVQYNNEGWRDASASRYEAVGKAMAYSDASRWERRIVYAAPVAAQAQPIQWPVIPPPKGQSPVLFEDGYAEGWAKCLSECQRAVARATKENNE